MIRKSITIVVLSCNLFASKPGRQQAVASTKCFDKARTQSELNECAGADANAADRELNDLYQSILKKYADRSLFIKRLREAQRAWLKYRDAQIEMKFPTSEKESDETDHGSVYPMCYSSYKASLTAQRSKELHEWLAGIEEGDVCSGSVKTPEDLKEAH
jgi:uncharacterized protein YecT (DUF1311 family)